jgi:hypothetical protein
MALTMANGSVLSQLKIIPIRYVKEGTLSICGPGSSPLFHGAPSSNALSILIYQRFTILLQEKM